MSKKVKFGIYCVFAVGFLLVVSHRLHRSSLIWSQDPLEFALNYKRTNTEPASYTQECVQLYKKIRFVNESLIFRPPLARPPDHMLAEFTMNGQMPIKKWWYQNEVYNSSSSSESETISIANVDRLRSRSRHYLRLGYKDKELNKEMHNYKFALANKSLVVIGTQVPWVESIGMELGCSQVTTLEYRKAKYEDPRMEWLLVNEFLDRAIRDNKVEQFDAATSFSSIEHSGLGRYGDPLNPNGDIEAMQQIHCMLKPGGILFLGLPTNRDGSSHIEFNVHRVYGKARLAVLFDGWKLLSRRSDTSGVHTIFVLKKI